MTRAHDETSIQAPAGDTAGRGAAGDGGRPGLPDALRAVLECARTLPLRQTLRALGVKSEPSSPVEWGYQSRDGSLVVTVWHDRIEREPDGTLAYWLDVLDWRREGQGPESERLARMQATLASFVRQEVYVVLLARGDDSADPREPACAAPDVVKWTLESAGQYWFVLRRPKARTA